MSNREELLLKMYDQMFNDINRHILVIWQSISVLIGAFAILALVEKKVVPLDIATSIILLLCAWLIAHSLDASYWYNRNLVIIANIERQFLSEGDLKQIHYYFGEHRPKNKMLTHLRLQVALAFGLGSVVVLFHLFERVVPGFSAPICNFDLMRSIPYFLIIGAIIYLWRLKNKCIKKYEEFLENSPGKEISTKGIRYGSGHGFKD
ncbi:hypothetical protein Enr10x_26850 [Gimesia panareensis]|uniref:Uncharacterized protein n=1 Tax=Gimesia panareensis TaxID=2527978 RepID=A0A517Q6X9_9PLAN|nr:hypothetical protein [Gimesia panareensis]QDT27368.1 hypothetical protein Enr10x_26850 [Gimesia panareensis]